MAYMQLAHGTRFDGHFSDGDLGGHVEHGRVHDLDTACVQGRRGYLRERERERSGGLALRIDHSLRIRGGSSCVDAGSDAEQIIGRAVRKSRRTEGEDVQLFAREIIEGRHVCLEVLCQDVLGYMG